MGFAVVAPDAERRALGVEQLYRRKTWNTNRGVVLASPAPAADLRTYVETMRASAGGFLGSSWWNQLGLQVVLQLDGLPPQPMLDTLVDKINTQGILVQSVFAIDRSSRASTSARTWGQVITGRFQDGIEAAIQDFARGGQSSPPSSDA